MLGFFGFWGRGVEETSGEERSALVGDGLGVFSDTEVVGSLGLMSLETDEGEIPGEDLVNSEVWRIDEDNSVTDGDEVVPGVAKVIVRVDDNRGLLDVVTAAETDGSWGAEDACPVTLAYDTEEEEVDTWLSTKKQTNIECKLKMYSVHIYCCHFVPAVINH